MTDGSNELERVREAVRRLMFAKGMKAKPLAKRAGLGDTSIRDMLDNEGRDIRLGTLYKISGAMDVGIDQLIGAAEVRITGRVGAGGSIIFDEADGETVPRPPGSRGNLEALEVIGDSMLPRYSSGDIVYIQREHDGVREDFVGDFCAARLSSGESYIKLLARGSRPGFWTLRSLNAADIDDVELEWATPIIYVLPRAGRRQLGY